MTAPEGQPLPCPACGITIATYIPIQTRVTWDVEWDEGVEYSEQDVRVGSRVWLDGRFGNAKRRSPEGLPWYVPRRSGPRHEPSRIRVPAAVTCSCGARVVLPGPGFSASAAATAPREQIRRDLEDDAAEAEAERVRRQPSLHDRLLERLRELGLASPPLEVLDEPDEDQDA